MTADERQDMLDIIVFSFEMLLKSYNIVLPNPEKEDDPEAENVYGTDRENLIDDIENTLTCFGLLDGDDDDEDEDDEDDDDEDDEDEDEEDDEDEDEEDDEDEDDEDDEDDDDDDDDDDDEDEEDDDDDDDEDDEDGDDDGNDPPRLYKYWQHIENAEMKDSLRRLFAEIHGPIIGLAMRSFPDTYTTLMRVHELIEDIVTQVYHNSNWTVDGTWTEHDVDKALQWQITTRVIRNMLR